MDERSEIVGFMDIGTNSIYLIVVDFVPGTLGNMLFQDKEVVRLGESLYRDGAICKSAIDKCRLVTDRFTLVAKQYGAKEVIAFATCAVREASNRTEVLKALESDGLDVRVIPGEEEARLTRLGVLGECGPKENVLLVDIGGGSTEISISNGRDILYLDSLPMGAVRYAYSYPYDPSKALTQEEYDSYQHNVDLDSYRSVRKIKEIGFTKSIGSSGTLETIAELCSAQRKNPDTSYFTLSELRPLMAKLRIMDSDQRMKVPGMGSNRVDIIVAGGAIAEELMIQLGIKKMRISHSALKDGMKVDYLLNHGMINFDIRDSSVKLLANRCQYDEIHAKEVQSKAMILFDDMKILNLHSMGGEMRMLLSYATTLHDIGEFFSYLKHHLTSYNIIIGSNMLGFDYKELSSIALMVRFHHKKFPSNNDPVLTESGLTNTVDILKCAMILKMADVMDRHHTQSVKDLKMYMMNGKLTLELYSDDDIGMEIWKLQDMKPEFKYLFEKEMDIVSKRLTSVKNENI